MPRRKLSRVPIIALLIALALGIPSAAQVYTDWLWFGETGYQQIFLRTLSAQTTLGFLAFLVTFGFVSFNLVTALRSAPRREFFIMTAEGPRNVAVDPRRLRPIAVLAGLIAALLAGVYASSQWDTWLFFRNA